MEEPSFFWTVALCTDLFSVLWLAAHVATVLILTILEPRFNARMVRIEMPGLPACVGTQVAQAVLAALEFLVFGSWAIKGHILMHQKGDVRWRKTEQDTMPTPFTNSFSDGPETVFHPVRFV
jgi:hypothetical protein